jgi:adenylate cyclase
LRSSLFWKWTTTAALVLTATNRRLPSRIADAKRNIDLDDAAHELAGVGGQPITAVADRKPTIDPQYLLTTEVVERPLGERPTHDTVDGVIEWLTLSARHNPSLVAGFDEFAWHMLAAGFPLLRMTLHVRTLHPQYLGASFVWWRTTGQTVQILVAHEVEDMIEHENNPVWRVAKCGETLRRRIDVADSELEFSVLHDLKAEGATDYFALPVKNSLGTNYMVTYVTDRSGGFTAQEISDLSRVSHRLPLLADVYMHRRIARNILDAYLGPTTGLKVLEG